MKRIITTLLVCVIAIGLFAPIGFSMTTQGVFAHAQIAHADPGNDKVWENIGSCGVFGSSSFGACINSIFYFLPFWVGGLVLKMAAWVLDITASLTLSSTLFTSAHFLQTGWALMRDISNLFFILILLYLAFCIVLDISTKTFNPKKTIFKVVLIALVINFSMFVTDIVIDTSNTLALVFYNQISVQDKAGHDLGEDPGEKLAMGGVATSTSVVEPKQLGVSLASAFHPQIFTNGKFWDSMHDPNAPAGSGVPTGPMMVILLALGCVYFMAAWSFFIAAMSFLGRMVELFILIIFSPLAFVSFIVPDLKKQPWVGWDDWSTRLFKTAFAAPMFFMMILLITLIIQGGLFAGGQDMQSTSAGTFGSWISTLIGAVIIPAAFLYIMLKQGTEFIKKASGVIGQWVADKAAAGVKMAGGIALGAATGGAGLAMQATVGAGAGALGAKMASSSMAKLAVKNIGGTGIDGKLARGSLNAIEKVGNLKNKSFNAKPILGKMTGLPMESKLTNMIPGMSKVSTTNLNGGYAGQAARKREDKEAKLARTLETIKKFGTDKNAKVSFDNHAKDREKDAEAEKENMDKKKSEFDKLSSVQDSLDKANAVLAGAIKAGGTAEPGARLEQIKVQVEFDKVLAAIGGGVTSVADAQAAYYASKDQHDMLTTGQKAKRDAHGNEIGRTPKLSVSNADGSPTGVTRGQAMATMSIAEVRQAGHNAENEPMKQYVIDSISKKYPVAESDIKRDQAGNKISVHVNSKPELRKGGYKMVQAIKTGLKYAAVGAVAGGGVASLPLAATGFLAGVLNEAFVKKGDTNLLGVDHAPDANAKAAEKTVENITNKQTLNTTILAPEISEGDATNMTSLQKDWDSADTLAIKNAQKSSAKAKPAAHGDGHDDH